MVITTELLFGNNTSKHISALIIISPKHHFGRDTVNSLIRFHVTHFVPDRKECTTRIKTIFMAMRYVYRTFYGLPHQYHAENIHVQKLHITIIRGSIHLTSRRWGKNAPPICLRLLGPDSNACTLLCIKHAASFETSWRHNNCQFDPRSSSVKQTVLQSHIRQEHDSMPGTQRCEISRQYSHICHRHHKKSFWHKGHYLIKDQIDVATNSVYLIPSFSLKCVRMIFLICENVSKFC